MTMNWLTHGWRGNTRDEKPVFDLRFIRGIATPSVGLLFDGSQPNPVTQGDESHEHHNRGTDRKRSRICQWQ